MSPRIVGVVSVGRMDWTIWRPILDLIRRDEQLALRLYVTGAHLDSAFGRTEEEIRRDGFEVFERLEFLPISDRPDGIADAMGRGIGRFSESFVRARPDLLLLLGDRFETFAAAAAAMPFKIPIGHLHGGESTEGAFDEAIRHSISKMSHLHFPATAFYAERLMRMGEEPWRISVVGAPSLDYLRTADLMDPPELERQFGLRLDPAPLLVTYHPVSLEFEQTGRHVEALLGALDEVGLPVVFTSPNSDTTGLEVRRMMEAFVDGRPQTWYVPTFGPRGYFSLMARARAMVGNSSSGIIESGSFKLPVVNIGIRQRGRYHDRNIIDVPPVRAQIVDGIRRALRPEFRQELGSMINAYGDGHAAHRIVDRVKSAPLDDSLVIKRFHDWKGPL